MVNENMEISQQGLDLIKNQENCVLHIYMDQLNIPTIAIGHALTPSEKSSGIYKNGITLEQAFDLLKKDLKTVENAMHQYIKVDLNQNQWDSICDLLFNCGTAPIITGTFGKLLNAGNFDGARIEMLKWCRGGGKILPVLQKRREIEAKLFSTPMASNPSPNQTVSAEPTPPPIISDPVLNPISEPLPPVPDAKDIQFVGALNTVEANKATIEKVLSFLPKIFEFLARLFKK